MTNDQVKSCGVLIVRGDPVQQVLLMIHPTRLDIPKGHVEPGETDEQCALRELHEETGITADDIELDPDFRFTLEYPVKQKRTGRWCDKKLIIFLGRLRRDVEIQVSEHEDYRWLDWQPPHQLQAETIDPLLACLAEHLNR